MSSTSNPAASVASVRSSARSYLAQLRAERLANRGAKIADEAQTGTIESDSGTTGAPDGDQKTARAVSPDPMSVGKRGVRVSNAETGTSNADELLRDDAIAELRTLAGLPEETISADALKGELPEGPAPQKAPRKKESRKKRNRAAASDASPAAKTTTRSKAKKQDADTASRSSKSPAPGKTSVAKTKPTAQVRGKQIQTLRRDRVSSRAANHASQQAIREARLTQRAAAAKHRANAAEARKAQAKARAEIKANASQSNIQSKTDGRRRSAASAGSATRSIMSSRPSGVRSSRPKTPKTSQPPLTELKGIGEAMSHRLAQAGIHTMSDLIALSVDDIQARLGPVSALANVAGWQQQARERLGKG
ncbi:MAG: hypothetical protein AAGF15_04185 [Pseudomonadota bacterium]